MKTITIAISLFFLLIIIFPSCSGAQEEDDYWSNIEKKKDQEQTEEEDVLAESDVPKEEPEKTEGDPPPVSPDPGQAQGAVAQPPPPEIEPVMLPPPSTETMSSVPETTSQQDDGEGIPYQEAFPEDFKKEQPVRIAVLSSPARPAAGQRIGMILGKFQKKRLEKALGRKVMVAYVSRSTKKHGENTIIRYRPDFLKAAIQVAAVLPKNQVVEAMQPSDMALHEVDVIVYLGDRIR